MKRKMEGFTERHTVLVVEDNDMNREILCDLLEDDFNVLQAENGVVGLLTLEEHGGDIAMVLLDVYMPVCDGFTFLERKQESGRFDSVPVIVMTASDSVDDEIRCLKLGATDFITKPYNIEVMKNRMKSLIRLQESAAMLNRLELDDLTRLYSKEFFFHNASIVLQSNPDGRYDIVCCDVENFRTMNERYGREQCDSFLHGLAAWLPQVLPGMIVGGRIGADVFAFLTEHQEQDWTDILKNAHFRMNPDQKPMQFSIKYGVAQDIDHEGSVSSSCDRATLALRQIKGRFNTHVAVYDEEMRRMQLREHQLVEFAEPAIENREFQIYYQPKHSLESDTTGGAEALVRWIHPQLGFISPGMFIPLFEKNGFITKLDFYIWEEVCRELRKLLDEGIPAVPISINVSRMDFEALDLAEKIASLADKYELDHSLLHIELTESIAGDNPELIASTLERLHENGFIIELDDFGSGYSSLTSLNTLTLDVLKLDMSIIRHAAATSDYSILRYAVLLADGMRLKTVAEGVETADQVAALKVLGCDYIQGYYYSKPLPGPEFEKYIAARCA
ncbi:MAG: EAL domain-containing protein [Oscillibacter sp.]|nr:EAL domain-containing protein [Oscillibacter sp.]